MATSAEIQAGELVPQFTPRLLYVLSTSMGKLLTAVWLA